jgi:hypothetical protein
MFHYFYLHGYTSFAVLLGMGHRIFIAKDATMNTHEVGNQNTSKTSAHHPTSR